MEGHAGDGSGVCDRLKSFLGGGFTVVEQLDCEVQRTRGQYWLLRVELQHSHFLSRRKSSVEILFTVPPPSYLQMVVECSDDGVTCLVHPPPTLRVGLGQHSVHVQNLNAGVHTASGAELSVSTEGPTATVPLVARHVGCLVGGGLRGGAAHLRLVLQVYAGPQLQLSLVQVPVSRLAQSGFGILKP